MIGVSAKDHWLRWGEWDGRRGQLVDWDRWYQQLGRRRFYWWLEGYYRGIASQLS